MEDTGTKNEAIGDTDVAIARVDAWLDALEGSERGPTSLSDWLTADAVFVEHPSLVNPAGRNYDCYLPVAPS